ncbi:MAG: hypothetical protein M1827_006798 [Pycnora praestabilis]|nr:MAG: hypothetical protein M1827_006798 [Pycnora praestabilis]
MSTQLPIQSLRSCAHSKLNFEPSRHALEAGYRKSTIQQRVLTSGKKNSVIVSPSTFPGPLVLPGDDLALDPDWPPQSLRSWVREKERNRVTPERNIIYIAAPPVIRPDVEFIHAWSDPQGLGKKPEAQGALIGTPHVQDIVHYLAAFYHSLPVKLLPSETLSFTSWDGSKSSAIKRKTSATKPAFIGLQTPTECVRIRTRPPTDGIFKYQINLDDLLDAAIAMLPTDAYTLLLLVHQDIFENDEDDFACGRAYGGSRVAVVSMARYHPALDEEQNVDRWHGWPASHCDAYMQTCCATESLQPKRKKSKERAMDEGNAKTSNLKASTSTAQPTLSPIHAAVAAHNNLPSLDPLSPNDRAIRLSSVWLARICRTASHELGHCFGIDHCVYYACVMQGSASLAEDDRQPPYLCPVDEAKLLRALGGEGMREKREKALLQVCERWSVVGMFVGLEAWIRGRRREEEREVVEVVEND